MKIKKNLFGNLLMFSFLAICAYFVRRCKKDESKYYCYYLFVIQWLKIKVQGKSIAEYLGKSGANNVAIYGMGEIGKLLCAEFEENNMQVAYGIDKNSSSDYSENNSRIKVYNKNDSLPECDMVIVTPFLDFKKIKQDLEKKVSGQIIPINQVIMECE